MCMLAYLSSNFQTISLVIECIHKVNNDEVENNANSKIK